MSNCFPCGGNGTHRCKDIVTTDCIIHGAPFGSLPANSQLNDILVYLLGQGGAKSFENLKAEYSWGKNGTNCENCQTIKTITDGSNSKKIKIYNLIVKLNNTDFLTNATDVYLLLHRWKYQKRKNSDGVIRKSGWKFPVGQPIDGMSDTTGTYKIPFTNNTPLYFNQETFFDYNGAAKGVRHGSNILKSDVDRTVGFVDLNFRLYLKIDGLPIISDFLGKIRMQAISLIKGTANYDVISYKMM